MKIYLRRLLGRESENYLYSVLWTTNHVEHVLRYDYLSAVIDVIQNDIQDDYDETYVTDTDGDSYSVFMKLDKLLKYHHILKYHAE